MKALVLADQPETLTRLWAALEELAYDVHVARSKQTALEEIATEPPDIAFVRWEPSDDLLTIIALAVREHNELTRSFRFVVAMLDDDTSAHRTAAYEAGADEIVRTNAGSRELVGLVRSAERIVRLEQRLHARIVDLESALRRLDLAPLRRSQALTALLPAAGAAGSFLLSRAWTRVDEVLTTMCNTYLQGGFSLVPRARLPPARSLGASISLTDVEHELTVELFFCASQSSARALAAAFSRSEELVDDEMVRDVLLELANSGMGAVTAAFSADKFVFAGAIPKPVLAEDAARGLEKADAQRVLAFHSRRATLHVLVTVRHLPRVIVTGCALREGMVLAVDVCNDAGVLIARAGTRLTETTAQTIARLAPKKPIELALV